MGIFDGAGSGAAAGSFFGPWGAGIGAGLGFLGGLFGHKSNQTQTTTPTMDPAFQGLQGQILGLIQNRLSNNSLPAGYEGQGIRGINSTFDAIKASQNNNLTARGLGTSPVAAAGQNAIDTARGSQVAQFEENLPLLQRELQTQDLGMAGNLLSLGRGATTTGNATTGGGIGGGFTDLGSMLGYLYGRGAFGARPTAGVGAV